MVQIVQVWLDRALAPLQRKEPASMLRLEPPIERLRDIVDTCRCRARAQIIKSCLMDTHMCHGSTWTSVPSSAESELPYPAGI